MLASLMEGKFSNDAARTKIRQTVHQDAEGVVMKHGMKWEA